MSIGLGLSLACLEELSWGQRIFGVQTLAWFRAHNVQSENNIHNLWWFQGSPLHLAYIALGLGGALGWTVVHRTPRRVSAWRRVCATEWFCWPYFIAVSVIYLLLEGLTAAQRFHVAPVAFRVGNFIVWRDQEPAETLLALGCVLFVVSNLLKTRSAAAPSESLPGVPDPDS